MPVEPSEFPVVRTGPGADSVPGIVQNTGAEMRLTVVWLEEIDQTPTPWRPVAEFVDSAIDAELWGDTLYVLSTAQSPSGEVLRLEASMPNLARADVVIEEIGAAAHGSNVRVSCAGSGRLV